MTFCTHNNLNESVWYDIRKKIQTPTKTKKHHTLASATRFERFASDGNTLHARAKRSGFEAHLLEQQLAVGAQTRHQVLGETEKRAEDFGGEVLARWSLQHEADHEEAAVLDHVLLDRLRRLDQLADEAQEFWAVGGILALAMGETLYGNVWLVKLRFEWPV